MMNLQDGNLQLVAIIAGVGLIISAVFYWPLAIVGAVLFVWGYKSGKQLLAVETNSNPQTILERDQAALKAEGLNSISSPSKLAFDYVDADGLRSRRTITVTGYNKNYFRGLCHLRNDYRTFRFDRVQDGLVDTATGEVMPATVASLRHK